MPYVDTLSFRFLFSVAMPSPVRKVPYPSRFTLVGVLCCAFFICSICLACSFVYLEYEIRCLCFLR